MKRRKKSKKSIKTFKQNKQLRSKRRKEMDDKVYARKFAEFLNRRAAERKAKTEAEGWEEVAPTEPTT